LLTLTPIVLSNDFIEVKIELFACRMTVTWPGHIDSKNSIFDGSIFLEQPIANVIDGANKIKFLALGLSFKRDIFSHAFIFEASQPRPHTPSVGWIKILPFFSQFDASAGDENSFKLIY
jgi:hypothetical protein